MLGQLTGRPLRASLRGFEASRERWPASLALSAELRASASRELKAELRQPAEHRLYPARTPPV